MHTDSGERIHVLESKKGQHAGLHSGMRVRVTGTWAGGMRSGGGMAAAAAAAAPKAFVAASTQRIGGVKRGQVRRELPRLLLPTGPRCCPAPCVPLVCPPLAPTVTFCRCRSRCRPSPGQGQAGGQRAHAFQQPANSQGHLHYSHPK